MLELRAPFWKVLSGCVRILSGFYAVKVPPHHSFFLRGERWDGANSTQTGVGLGGEIDRRVSNRALGGFVKCSDRSVESVVFVECADVCDSVLLQKFG